MKKDFKNGFTLIELVIIMVILGVLAAVAIPRIGNTIDSSEISAEEAVIGSLRSALEVYAMDQVVMNSNKSYPFNPFDELDKTPEGYTGIGTPDFDGEWVFTSDSHVAHQRNDNTRFKWYYNSMTGEFGNRTNY
jgi:prepilin-type N-terminal cleavage/methylation domain-containing protein